MYKRSFICVSLLIFTILFSCQDDSPNKNVVQEKFESDTLRPDNITFPPYEDTIIMEILENIKLCTSDTANTDKLPPCKHNLFRVFKFNPSMSWRDGFLVEIKSGIFSPTRQVLCIYYTENKYRIVNQYLGVLLEVVTTPEGFSDLLIGYLDSEVGTVAIKHVWKENHYTPVEVMEINNHFVKEAYKDSLKEIYINNFVWGY